MEEDEMKTAVERVLTGAVNKVLSKFKRTSDDDEYQQEQNQKRPKLTSYKGKNKVCPSTFLRERTPANISKKGKGKIFTYERDIICIPKWFADEDDLIKLPRKKNFRVFLATNKLLGKIQLKSDMEQSDIYNEIREVFHVPMANQYKFRFKILQPSGGDTRSLMIPELSSSYKWTAASVAGRNAKTPIYIVAEDELELVAPLAEDPIGDGIACSERGQVDALSASENFENFPRERIRDSRNTKRAKSPSRIVSTASSSSSSSSTDVGGQKCVQVFTEEPVWVDPPDSEHDADEAILQYVMEESRQTREPQLTPGSLPEILKTLSDGVESERFHMIIRREHVLSDALHRVAKPSFHPAKRMAVEFVGEVGSDTGGLTREFFRLFGKAMAQKYLEDSGSFKHDVMALNEGIFQKLGKLVAMAVVHGGTGLHVFNNTVFTYMSGTPESEIIANVSEVPDPVVKSVLEEMTSAVDVDSIRGIAIDNSDLLIGSGVTKPLALINAVDKIDIVQAVSLHHVLLHSKAELDQFCSGLEALGVLNAVKKQPPLFRCMFTSDGIQKLTADMLRTLFKEVRYSIQGSNAKEREKSAYMQFVEYLDEVELNTGKCPNNGESVVTLPIILSFFTGAEEVPPLGFPHDPVLNFSADGMYPTASTCAIEFTLPTKYSTYPEFKSVMDFAMFNHGGFGLA